MNILDTNREIKDKYLPLMFIKQFKILARALPSHEPSHFGSWLIESLGGARCSFFFFLSPSLGRSDILRDNYLATGHEYNTDGTPRRLTVKPALSLLAVNSCHSPPPSLPRTSSRAVASFTCSSIFSAANTFTVFHTRSRERAASLMDALLWWCGQRRGITVMRSSQQSKSLHGGGGDTDLSRLAPLLTDIDLAVPVLSLKG